MTDVKVQLKLFMRNGEVTEFIETLPSNVNQNNQNKEDITSLHKAVKKIQTDVNNKLTEIVEQEKISNNITQESMLGEDAEDEDSDDSDGEPKEKKQKT